MAPRRSPTSADIESIAADAVQQALMSVEFEETRLQVELASEVDEKFTISRIGPCSLPFRPSDIATVMGIPNVASPIDLKTDGTKASLRRILGSKQTMDRHNIHLKLKEYVPQEGALAVEISVKLWVALLCSCFFFPTSGRSGLLSILPYLDDLHEMKNANWAAAIQEYLISGVKAFRTVVGSSKTIFLTGCVYLEVNVRDEQPTASRRLTASSSNTSRAPPSDNSIHGILIQLQRQNDQLLRQNDQLKRQNDQLHRQNNILQSMDRRLHILEEQFERQPQWQHPPPETESAMLTLPPPELPTASVRSHAVAEKSSQRQDFRVLSYRKENRPNNVAAEICRLSHSGVEGGEKEGAKGGGGDGEEGGGEEEEGG
ncbi:hypothetical protein Taro_009530 [Colocasia esculenta]|uniref:Uncharacterized protein n=1 Tax=Colocasia esculenta TaxID=4460 RepID=A0A843U490_COLES|nr:hypothetical protein [Colocasia esculenta]